MFDRLRGDRRLGLDVLLVLATALAEPANGLDQFIGRFAAFHAPDTR